MIEDIKTNLNVVERTVFQAENDLAKLKIQPYKSIKVNTPRTRKKRIQVKVDRKSGMDYETLDESIRIIESFAPKDK